MSWRAFMMYTINDLYDLNETIAKDLFEGKT